MAIDPSIFTAAMRQLQAQTGGASNPALMAQFFLGQQPGAGTLDDALAAAQNYLNPGSAPAAAPAPPPPPIGPSLPDPGTFAFPPDLLSPGGGVGGLSPSTSGQGFGPGSLGFATPDSVTAANPNATPGSLVGPAQAAQNTNQGYISNFSNLGLGGRLGSLANTGLGLFGLGIPGIGPMLSLAALLSTLGKAQGNKANLQLSDLIAKDIEMSMQSPPDPNFSGRGFDPSSPGGLAAPAGPAAPAGTVSVGEVTATDPDTGQVVGTSGPPTGTVGIVGTDPTVSDVSPATAAAVSDPSSGGGGPTGGGQGGLGEGVGGAEGGGIGTGPSGVSGGEGGVAAFHRGGYVRGRGREVTAKLQPGEFVVPRGKTAERLRAKTEGPRPGPSPEAIAALDRSLDEARQWLGQAKYPTSRV